MSVAFIWGTALGVQHRVMVRTKERRICIKNDLIIWKNPSVNKGNLQIIVLKIRVVLKQCRMYLRTSGKKDGSIKSKIFGKNILPLKQETVINSLLNPNPCQFMLNQSTFSNKDCYHYTQMQFYRWILKYIYIQF